MNLLTYLVSPAWQYTEDCPCGGTVVIGTDGDGTLTESCIHCHAFKRTPRRGAPMSLHVTPIVLEGRSAIEEERRRMNLPQCATETCRSHVAHPRATHCPGCSETERRRKNRERMRRKADLARALARRPRGRGGRPRIAA